jgi:hypothetical protein
MVYWAFYAFYVMKTYLHIGMMAVSYTHLRAHETG